MGRKPKKSKRLYLKFDHDIYDLIKPIVDAKEASVTAIVEQGVVLWLKRRKAQAKQRPKHPTP